jgi:DnaK suppressor protein
VEALSAAEQEELHRDLVRLREELRLAVEAGREAARPVDLDQPIGRLSRMDALQQQSMARASRAALVLRAQQVEGALRRHTEGELGVCVECGADVGFARLKARPEAPFCLGCQGLHEARR